MLRAAFLADAGWATTDDTLTRLRARRAPELAARSSRASPSSCGSSTTSSTSSSSCRCSTRSGRRATSAWSSSSSVRSRPAALRGPGRAEPVRAAEPVAAAGAAAARTAGWARRAWARFRAGDLGALAEEARAPADGLLTWGRRWSASSRTCPDPTASAAPSASCSLPWGGAPPRPGRRSPTPRARSGRRSWATRVALRAAGRDGGAATGAGRGRGGPDRPGHRSGSRPPGAPSWPEGLLEASRRGERWLGGARLDPGASANGQNA